MVIENRHESLVKDVYVAANYHDSEQEILLTKKFFVSEKVKFCHLATVFGSCWYSTTPLQNA